MTRVHRALHFAIKAHGDQVRKYTGEPYWHHPKAVAEIVWDATRDEDLYIAALLHDTVEDTTTTLTEIEAEFGYRVAELVEEVTDVSTPSDGNREYRKALDREHLRDACPGAQTIKLADLIHNTMSIVEHDKAFASVFLQEMILLLIILDKGDKALHERAFRLTSEGLRKVDDAKLMEWFKSKEP